MPTGTVSNRPVPIAPAADEPGASSRGWILHPEERILLIHRWSHDGHIVVQRVVQRAAAGEVIRAEPFDAIELRVGVLFGDEEDE